ncbi:SH3 domain-containing protein [Lachnospiraceae bacterium MD1]|jgi:uncharacterized protein YgiM (DUF1202 family)|uniref:SH3 domain-containing protein n=1 Tax=Variimorphobacter saccharofermentans TaxID=2755051 RepID=A0A839JZZ4_9FIRM|nr:SH3 domain-containing protein [Variimorphobacter saccharofermentans]MBB2182239.1 SH3 domain-containing protein [Variimorphobacter saccharofermentans]
MKKMIYLCVITLILCLSGCGKKDQMTNFIPTPIPEKEINFDDNSEEVTKEDDVDISDGEATDDEKNDNTESTPSPSDDNEEGKEEDTTETAEATPTIDPNNVGITTPMYVKLDKYGDVLNVRSAPSTKSEAVGFLVHTEKIRVIEIKDGWASFVMDGKIRYVKASYLVEERPDYLPVPTPTPVPKATKAAGNSGTSQNTDDAQRDNVTPDEEEPPEI